jgi:sulfur-oxidizing protein SoxB
MQKVVDAARAAGAAAVVLLSHNGMDVDLKLASRVSGIDAILGGHTHDAVPLPTIVKNPRGQTVVTNAGCNGKFVGVLDLQVRDRRAGRLHYTLLPGLRQPFAGRPRDGRADRADSRPSRRPPPRGAGAHGGLVVPARQFQRQWRPAAARGTDAGAGRADRVQPGLSLGYDAVAGQAITREWLMDQTATTYSYATVTEMSGEQVKTVLEDVADNLFKPRSLLPAGRRHGARRGTDLRHRADRGDRVAHP